MKTKNRFLRLCLCLGKGMVALAFYAGCAPDLQLTGGGSDTEVSGRVTMAEGQAAAGAIVALIDTSFDQSFDEPLSSKRFDTTDANGSFHFDSVRVGLYNIAAWNPGDGTQAILWNIEVSKGVTTKAGDAHLKKSARLKIVLPDDLSDKPARLSVPGTMLFTTLSGSGNIAEFPSVPQGVLPVVRYRKEPAGEGIVLFRDVAISSAGLVMLNPNAYNEVWGGIAGVSGSGEGVSVSLVPLEYNPAFSGALPGKMSAVTGKDGIYHLYNIERGKYNLYAAHPASGLKILDTAITVNAQPAIKVPDIGLQKTATLIVPLPDSLYPAAGTICMPGSLEAMQFFVGTRKVVFNPIAQGMYRSVVCLRGGVKTTLFTDVVIDSAGVFELDPYAAWGHAAKITLNTTAGGANVQETLREFPVLIRLTDENFNFSEAKGEGEDLRITTPSNAPIAFEIEQWDSANAMAEVWVRVDTVHGNDEGHYLLMRWGNRDAKTASNAGAVFDTADGFRGVWHLCRSGLEQQPDATANNFDGTPFEMDGSSDCAGVIGRALDFDGSSRYLAVLDARESPLDVQVDTAYTVSAWVYARNLQQDNRVMVSKGSAQYGLMMNERNHWTFYGGRRGFGVDTTTTYPATINSWTLLTGVRRGKTQYLYVNGTAVDSTLEAAGVNVNVSNKYYDLVFGRQSDDQSQWFDGMVDEVRVSAKADNAAWIRLCYENQKAGQRFVTIGRIQ